MNKKYIILIYIILLTSCSLQQKDISRGSNELNISNVKIKKNISKKPEILTNLGPPSIISPFNKNIIYYISSSMEKKFIEQNKFKKITILELTFDDQNLLKDYNIIKQENVKNFRINSVSELDNYQRRERYNFFKDIFDGIRRQKN